MSLSLEAVQIARHESDHAAALFVLLGADAVGSVTRTRADSGVTRLADLPGFRHPSLNAADLAVALLVPLMDPTVPDAGCGSDVDRAYECAEVAYTYRPDHERGLDPVEWADRWTHNTVSDRAREMLDGARFRRLRGAIEAALDSETRLPAAAVRGLLEAADSQGRRA